MFIRLTLIVLIGFFQIVIASEGDGEMPSISAELYWYYEKQGLLDNVENVGDEIRGYYRSRHGKSPFKIEKLQLCDAMEKAKGYLRVLDDYVSRVTYSSGVEAVNHAEAAMKEMTGLNLDRNDWDDWIADNRKYIYWSEGKKQFVIDTEAKKKRVPTLKYRKLKPCLQEDQL